jgi:UDP-N-acetylglucosamine 2-epimerase
MAFARLSEPVIFPIHPRTRKKISDFGLDFLVPSAGNVRLIEPVGYLDMLCLQQNARLILTDSGGIQKEAYCLGVPCITMREETEWVETVENKWNILVGANTERIVRAVSDLAIPSTRPNIYGDGTAAQRCVNYLTQ